MQLTLDLLLPAIQGCKLPEGSVEYLKGLKNNAEDVKSIADQLKVLYIRQIWIKALKDQTKDDMIVTVGIVGSHYIWMARYFKSYEPRHLLFSNGMQTLGLPSVGHLPAALSVLRQKPFV